MVSDGGRWSFPSHLDAISQGRRCGRDLLLFTNRHIKTHVVHCTADGGVAGPANLKGKPGISLRSVPTAKAVLQQSLSLTRSITHFPSPPLRHRLSHTHTLSLCFSVSQPLILLRSPVSSLLCGVQREVIQLAG